MTLYSNSPTTYWCAVPVEDQTKKPLCRPLPSPVDEVPPPPPHVKPAQVMCVLVTKRFIFLKNLSVVGSENGSKRRISP